MNQCATRLSPHRHRYAWVLTAILLPVLFSAHAQTPLDIPTVRPTSGLWDSGSGFRFGLKNKKEEQTRKALSGIACNLNAAQQRICLMVFDEGVEARFATVLNNQLAVDQGGVTLRAEEGELDAEGAATDGTYFYITGSHSARREGCRSNTFSRHVIRFRLDPATGRALRSPASDPQGRLVDYADSGRLWSIMQLQTELKAHVQEDTCGVNIEGLAVKDKRLYFGFRSPAKQGRTIILVVDTAELFEGGDPKAFVKPVELGAGRGIRDMVAVKTGFLLLAGPDDDPATKKSVGWTISWWDGMSVTPKPLAALDVSGVKLRKLTQGENRVCADEKLKPEAMTVLDETPLAYKLLVLSDGMCDGGALTFTVAR